MTPEQNIQLAREFIQRSFNQGDLSVIDEQVAPDGVDHQEALGTDFAQHLKQVVSAMRFAFPDLHFEIHHILADGEIVAFHSTMTGTHLGALRLPNMPPLPATGKSISVRHMHFLRMVNGKVMDLWHVWDTPTLMRQLGVLPQMPQQARPA